MAVISLLTHRGHGFLSAGVTAAVCALVLGKDELAMVALLLVTLPLAALLVVGRAHPEIGLARIVDPVTASVGQRVEVTLRISKGSGRFLGVLLLEERLPHALGSRPRFVVVGRGQWTREVTYGFRCEHRGRYHLGPMTARVTDPFGLVERDRTFRSTTDLIVTPITEPVPPATLSGSWTGSGDNRPRSFAGGSAEDVTVREYRRGDDLRRVHWGVSAHAGELMVRREEQPWQSRATLLLDNRRTAHQGGGPHSSFERAVSVTASLAEHLARRGYRVRLVTADGAESGWHEHGVQLSETRPLLESLAVLEPSTRAALDTSWMEGPQAAGLVVAVLGDVRTLDVAALRRIRHAAGTALALHLPSAAWVGSPRVGSPRVGSTGGGADALTTEAVAGHGWRAIALRPGEPLGPTWQRLGAAGRRGTPATVGGGA